MKNEWYEIAVSYTDDGGTESVESKDTLVEAIKFVANCDEFKWDEVEFMFIDRWWCDADKYSNTKFDEPAIVFNKKEMEWEEQWLYPDDLGEDLVINIFDGNQINIYTLPENWRRLSKITSIHNLMIEK